MDKQRLLNEVKRIVHKHDPRATVLLYGSRARDDASEESDWDFMILTDLADASEARNLIRRELNELEWATGNVLCPIFHTIEEWSSPMFAVMPFHQNVEREGIPL